MMRHADLLDTTDAMVWAEEFVRTLKRNDWKLEDIDEGLMVGWFANAMVAQEYAMLRQCGNIGMPTLQELEDDNITVRHPTVEETADSYIQDMMKQEKGQYE